MSHRALANPTDLGQLKYLKNTVHTRGLIKKNVKVKRGRSDAKSMSAESVDCFFCLGFFFFGFFNQHTQHLSFSRVSMIVSSPKYNEYFYPRHARIWNTKNSPTSFLYFSFFFFFISLEKKPRIGETSFHLFSGRCNIVSVTLARDTSARDGE